MKMIATNFKNDSPAHRMQEPYSLFFGEYKNPKAYHFGLFFKQEARGLGFRKIERGAPPAVLLSASTCQPPASALDLQNLSYSCLAFLHCNNL